MKNWLKEKCAYYVKRIIEMKAGPQAQNLACPRCKTGRAIWRCKDCTVKMAVCVLCCRNAHKQDLFHRVEKWNGDDANRLLYAYKTHKWPVWGHERSEMLWGARTGSPCNQRWVREEGGWGECLQVLRHWGTRGTRVSRVRESYTNRRRTSRARVDDKILLSVRLRLYESSRVTTRGSRTWGTT